MSKVNYQDLIPVIRRYRKDLAKYDLRSKPYDKSFWERAQDELSAEIFYSLSSGEFFRAVEGTNFLYTNELFKAIYRTPEVGSLELDETSLLSIPEINEFNPYWHIAHGSIDFIQDCGKEKFRQHFEMARNISYPDIAPYDKLGVNSCWPLSSALDRSEYSSLSVVSVVGRQSDIAEDDVVVLRVSDSGYFARYFPRHAAENDVCDGVLRAYHIINPSDEVLKQVSSLITEPKFRFTVEFTKNTSRAYYATARLMRLREFSRLYPCRMFILDMDAAIIDAGIKHADNLSLNGIDIAMNQNKLPNAYLPWRTIPANKLYFDFTKSNIQELGSLISGISLSRFYSLQQKFENIWWVDQNILFEAQWNKLFEKASEGKVGRFPKKLVQLKC